MHETAIENKNIQTRSPNKFVVYGATLLTVAGVVLATKELSNSTDPFATNTPVPAESQPHTDYLVKAGDTEGTIAKFFGHENNLDFENMLNKQIPPKDQPNRLIRPGENLRIPK